MSDSSPEPVEQVGADRRQAVDDERGYATILATEVERGSKELERPAAGLFFSGLSAGLDVGFGPLAMAITWTLFHGVVSDPWLHVMMANAYTVGFIFVVLGRSELFTEHTTLAALPVLDGRAGVGRLARLWALVYSSNLIGTLAVAGLLATFAPRLGIVDPEALAYLGEKMAGPSALDIVASAVAAGWLMGLVSWLVVAAREALGKIVLVWLVTFVIGFGGFHHSIAGSVEVMAAVFAGVGLGVGDWLHFQVWSTVGNIIGGLFFVAVVKYAHASRD